MTPITDVRVTIEIGNRRFVTDCATLEAATGAMLRRALIRLALCGPIGAEDIHSQTREGGGRGRENVSDNEFNTSVSEPFVSSRKREVSQTSGLDAIDDAVNAVALALAASLRDDHSERFYHLAASRLPLSLVRQALMQALELDASEVRRSRAAYFTAILRPHLGRRT